MTINKVFKKVLNVNNVKIKDVNFYDDIKGQTHLNVKVSLYKRIRNRCPLCHKECMGYDNPEYQRKWRHIDIGGLITEIVMDSHRICCPIHGVLNEEVPFAYYNSQFTKDFDLTATYFARSVSKSFISDYMRISWQTVGSCVARALKDLEPNLKRRLKNLENIGIDETSYKKGHSYITVIVNHDSKEVVWLHKNHGKETLKLFFEELSEEQRKTIKTITGDGARWIDDCIKEYVPNVIRCTDAYHTVGWAQEALDEVRTESWRKANKDVKNIKISKGRPLKNDAESQKIKEKKEYAKAIKGAKYTLGKNPENLTSVQMARLELIANTDPRLMRAYNLKESLRIILHMNNVEEAEILLNEWLWKASHSKIESFVELSKKIRRHKEHILNTIGTGLSNARIEAINNNIKLIIRRAYGFRNIDNLFSMVYLSCSNIVIPLPNRQKIMPT